MMMRARGLECLTINNLSFMFLRRAVVTQGTQGTECLKLLGAEVEQQLLIKVSDKIIKFLEKTINRLTGISEKLPVGIRQSKL